MCEKKSIGLGAISAIIIVIIIGYVTAWINRLIIIVFQSIKDKENEVCDDQSQMVKSTMNNVSLWMKT